VRIDAELARDERYAQRVRASAACSFLRRQRMPVDTASVVELSEVNPRVARRIVDEHNASPVGLARVHGSRGPADPPKPE
jgi:hypothetical protein